jgi:hypothetical protein
LAHVLLDAIVQKPDPLPALKHTALQLSFDFLHAASLQFCFTCVESYLTRMVVPSYWQVVIFWPDMSIGLPPGQSMWHSDPPGMQQVPHTLLDGVPPQSAGQVVSSSPRAVSHIPSLSQQLIPQSFLQQQALSDFHSHWTSKLFMSQLHIPSPQAPAREQSLLPVVGGVLLQVGLSFLDEPSGQQSIGQLVLSSPASQSPL